MIQKLEEGRSPVPVRDLIPALSREPYSRHEQRKRRREGLFEHERWRVNRFPFPTLDETYHNYLVTHSLAEDDPGVGIGAQAAAGIQARRERLWRRPWRSTRRPYKLPRAGSSGRAYV